MIKRISQLLLFFSLFLTNTFAASLQKPRYRHTATSSVINNDSMLKILLLHVAKDLGLRLISKTFMKAFDESCTMQLLLLDSRIKYLIQDEDGKVILSPIGTFLSKSVPLLKLYNSYLDLLYSMDKESFDERFPVLEFPDDATADALIKLKKEQDTIDSQRFMEMLRNVIHFLNSRYSIYTNSSMKLPSLYRLLVATFSEQTFINEIVNSIDFPMNSILSYAISCRLKNHNGAEILSRVSINSHPYLILNAIETGNPDLVRAILNNPQNDLSILTKQRPGEHYEPMNVAAIKGNVEIINLLLERGFSADFKGSGGIRPIHSAIRRGNYDAVVRLFEYDKDVASNPLRALDEHAPIVLAAFYEYVEIIRFFLAQESVNLIKNRETSRRLADIALQRRNAKLGQLLIDSGKVKLTPAEIKKLRRLEETEES